jgi:hypothetical protein
MLRDGHHEGLLQLEGERLTKAMTVTSRAAAAVFRRPRLCRILAMASSGPRSASELAAESGMPLNLASYHLTRMVGLGLLQDAGIRKRAGRAIKLYRAAAAEYFVPAEIADHSLGAELAGELRHLLQRADRDIAGELFYIDGGRIRATKVASERCGPDTALELWADLTLDTATAAVFRNDLRQLVDRYRGAQKPEAPNFLFHCAVVRRRDGGSASGGR